MSRRVGPPGWAWHCDSPLLRSPSTLPPEKLPPAGRGRHSTCKAQALSRAGVHLCAPSKGVRHRDPVRDPTPRKPRPSGVRPPDSSSHARGGVHTRTHTYTPRAAPARTTAHCRRAWKDSTDGASATSTGRATTKVATTGRRPVSHGLTERAADGRTAALPHSHPPIGRPPELCLHAGTHPTRWLSHPEGQRPGGHASLSPQLPAAQQASSSSGSPAGPSCGQNAGDSPNSHTGRPPAWKGHPL